MCFVIITISVIGYLLQANSSTLKEALMANKMAYLGACFLPLFITLVIFTVCDIRLRKLVTIIGFIISFIVYLIVLSTGQNELFYTSFSVYKEHGIMVLEKEGGIFHIILYLMILFYLSTGLFAIIWSYFKKKNVSIKNLSQLIFIEVITISAYGIGHFLKNDSYTIPMAYVLSEIPLIIITSRIYLYDINATVTDTVIRKGHTGYISFDKNFIFLGANKVAFNYCPELSKLRVDRALTKEEKIFDQFQDWLLSVKEYGTPISVLIENKEKDKFFKYTVDFLYAGEKKAGYQIIITDDTKNQAYIKLLNNHNSELSHDNTVKAEHIQAIQNKMILGMADMVESRDSLTGGHIKRTSEVVRILIEEMKEDENLKLTDDFCESMVKAAPMHDLGKIGVEDIILRKPGRFTDKEYEKMKLHAEKGAEIVHTVLNGIEDPEFQKIAENVAHFHHERWDGSGYPNGLKGEEIPFEARIMAIADVYDALVSKRCYKEKMSFEEAYNIIEAGMGIHFDDRLNKYFLKCRYKLENFYKDFDEDSDALFTLV